MKYLELLRAQRAELDKQRAAAVDALEEIAAKAIDESRSLDDDESAKVEELRSTIAAFDDPEGDAAKLDERIGELEKVAERTNAIKDRPEIHVIRKEDPADVLENRDATPGQLADAITRSIDGKVEDPENMAHARRVFQRHAADRPWARQMIARSTPEYTRAWAKLVTGNEAFLSPEEQRAALSVGSNTNGGYLVPTHLDPTIILTNNGTSNVIRSISRVVSLTTGNQWNGVSSAGVTASWDGELTEVSDDSPTFARVSVPTYVAQAFVQASIASTEDIDGLASDILMLLADAKDRLEAAAHATGSGSSQPTGIFTALDANTNVEITSTTAATVGLVDLHSMYRQVPVRWRGKSTWLMNPLYSLAIKALGTAVSASFTTDLTAGTAGTLLGRPMVESDDAPTTQTTTALDNEIIVGDFSNFVIVDMPGSMGVEYVPHLFNTANNLPDGRRGWFMYWRNGSDSVNDLGFRLLQDKTSA
jgi:HK97 family phage major capsid protein